MVVGAPQASLQQTLSTSTCFQLPLLCLQVLPCPLQNMFSHLFICLHILRCIFNVSCRIVFAKLDDLEMCPNSLVFVSSSSYCPMTANILINSVGFVHDVHLLSVAFHLKGLCSFSKLCCQGLHVRLTGIQK